MQCLLDVLLAQVTLSIVNQEPASPVEKHSIAHELLLHVVRLLNNGTQVVRTVQDARLDTHLQMLDRVLALFSQARRVEHSLAVLFALHGRLCKLLILHELLDEGDLVLH